MAAYRGQENKNYFNANAAEFCLKSRPPHVTGDMLRFFDQKSANFNLRNPLGLQYNHEARYVTQQTNWISNRNPWNLNHVSPHGLDWQQNVPMYRNANYPTRFGQDGKPSLFGMHPLDHSNEKNQSKQFNFNQNKAGKFTGNQFPVLDMSDSDKAREMSLLYKWTFENPISTMSPLVQSRALHQPNANRDTTVPAFSNEPSLYFAGQTDIRSRPSFSNQTTFNTQQQKPLTHQNKTNDNCSSIISLDRQTSRKPRVDAPLQSSIKAPHGEESFSETNEDLKAVIVHFIGSDTQARNAEKNFSIVCKDGVVQANRDVLTTNSSVFFNSIKKDSNTLTLEHVEAHSMKLIVSLITTGRVVVLQKRLKSFMKRVGSFKILGVFSSEEIEREYFEFSDLSATNLPSEQDISIDNFKVDIPQPLGLEAKVRCLVCRNVLLKTTFHGHFEEYHAVLQENLTCCNSIFSTRYDFITHEKMSCRKLSNHQTDFPDTSGISMNLKAERSGINSHSTPIKHMEEQGGFTSHA